MKNIADMSLFELRNYFESHKRDALLLEIQRLSALAYPKRFTCPECDGHTYMETENEGIFECWNDACTWMGNEAALEKYMEYKK